MDSTCKNCVFSISYAKQILADIDEARMAERPMGLNSPAWLLLDLATAADYAANSLGGRGICPETWNALADTKKEPSTNLADYPSKEELLKTLEAAYMNTVTLWQACSEEKRNEPQKLGFFENEFPTIGDIATFLMVTHANTHLGQLSAWRRAMGKPPLF